MIASTKPYNFLAVALIVIGLMSSCVGSITTALITPALENMQEQEDIDLVCEGTPSYLLMIDSLIAGDPDNTAMLRLGTKAYSGYLGAMVECQAQPERIEAMANKAKGYSDQLLLETLNITPEDDLERFTTKLKRSGSGDVQSLIWAAIGWISWVQQQQGAPAAMADLGKIEQLLLRLVNLDEREERGMAHFLLGSYYGIRPAMLGGNPQKSKTHFERALALSERKMLIYQTLYAQTYARATLNKDLHNALLQEVIDFPLEQAKTLTLTNQLAKRKAARLIDDGFFDE